MVIKPARRIACALLVAVALVAASAATAQADPPTITKGGPSVVDYVDTSCGFDVALYNSLRGSVDIHFVDSAGNYRDISAVQLDVVVLTNVQTGKMIRVNISGPGQYTGNVNSDGFKLIGTGGWGWFGLNPADLSVPGIFVTTGRFVQTVDSQGDYSFSWTGRLRNMCAELAA